MALPEELVDLFSQSKISCMTVQGRSSRPVLSKLLSARASGYLKANVSKWRCHFSILQSTYSFLMLLTTALVNGEALSVVYELIFADCLLE